MDVYTLDLNTSVRLWSEALLPRIHKVDALLESIGFFKIEISDGFKTESVELELLDCQPLPSPQRPHRPFAKHLRKIEYLSRGRAAQVETCGCKHRIGRRWRS